MYRYATCSTEIGVYNSTAAQPPMHYPLNNAWILIKKKTTTTKWQALVTIDTHTFLQLQLQEKKTKKRL